MADNKIELNEENLEGVAGGAGAKIEARDIGKKKNAAGSKRTGETKKSKIKKNNIKNTNNGIKQNIINQGTGNEADGDFDFGGGGVSDDGGDD